MPRCGSSWIRSNREPPPWRYDLRLLRVKKPVETTSRFGLDRVAVKVGRRFNAGMPRSDV